MPAVPLTHNLLLDAMPEDSRNRLGGSGRVYEIQLNDLLFDEHQETPVFFPLDSVISLLRRLMDGTMVEVGMIGPEGAAAVNGILGVPQNPHSGLTQGRGMVLRVDAAIVRAEMAREPRVNALLLKFVYTHISELSQLAACNRLHNVEQRLAHWLLILHDRTGSDMLSLTHEFLALMLATRRPGITVAMGTLAGAGAIEQGRNRVRVVDREKLEELACECYREHFDEFKLALGFAPIAKTRISEID